MNLPESLCPHLNVSPRSNMRIYQGNGIPTYRKATIPAPLQTVPAGSSPGSTGIAHVPTNWDPCARIHATQSANIKAGAAPPVSYADSVTGSASPSPPRLVVVTREHDPSEDPLTLADPHDPLVWQWRGNTIVGQGAALRLDIDGDRPPRTPVLADRWREIARLASVDDTVRTPGTGLIGFGAMAFDDRSALQSALIVPRTIVGHRDGRAWITRIRREDEELDEPRRIPLGPYWSAAPGPGALDPEGYRRAVVDAIARIRARQLDKVVLARDLTGSAPADADLRRLVRALATGYPDCWTYAIDGIIGSSPETLVTVARGSVTARVLAGTAGRGAGTDDDARARVTLATSAKDLDEHRFAVHSVLGALRPHTRALAAAEQPFTLRLPNLWHLATDVEGTLSGDAGALDLVAALHPTAAVAGTPTDAAMALIGQTEPFDRGRYAGPVGWVDAAGDGEWAIALRCAQFGPRAGTERAVVAHAGAGIVADSVAENELLETRIKFRPIIDALA